MRAALVFAGALACSSVGCGPIAAPPAPVVPKAAEATGADPVVPATAVSLRVITEAPENRAVFSITNPKTAVPAGLGVPWVCGKCGKVLAYEAAGKGQVSPSGLPVVYHCGNCGSYNEPPATTPSP